MWAGGDPCEAAPADRGQPSVPAETSRPYGERKLPSWSNGSSPKDTSGWPASRYPEREAKADASAVRVPKRLAVFDPVVAALREMACDSKRTQATSR